MAKAPKPTRKAYIATRTIHAGTPKEPVVIAAGDEVDLPVDELKSLLAAGAIREDRVKADEDGGEQTS